MIGKWHISINVSWLDWYFAASCFVAELMCFLHNEVCRHPQSRWPELCSLRQGPQSTWQSAASHQAGPPCTPLSQSLQCPGSQRPGSWPCSQGPPPRTGRSRAWGASAAWGKGTPQNSSSLFITGPCKRAATAPIMLDSPRAEVNDFGKQCIYKISFQGSIVLSHWMSPNNPWKILAIISPIALSVRISAVFSRVSITE